MNTEDMIPIDIMAGLIHAQFETLHPFFDGNGRTGRMLITFYLWIRRFSRKPVLFLSSYFKKHQQLYYEKLFGYQHANVFDWIDFFLDGVIEIAHEVIAIVGKITALREKDMQKVQALGKRVSESAMAILPKLYGQPLVNNVVVQRWTGFTCPGALTVIDRFIRIGILIPKDKDKKYAPSYVYKAYLSFFTESENTMNEAG